MAAPRRLLGARAGLIKTVATVASLAVLTVGAVLAHGFDVKQTPVDDSSIWVLQSGDGSRYARVNTDLAELDTVKTVRSPSELVQTSSTVLLFAQNNEKVVRVDPARPQDLGDDPADYESTPAGTAIIAATGDYIGYLTGTGAVYAGAMADDTATQPIPVDPYADEEVAEGDEPRIYQASAIAISPAGVLYSYSAASGTVLRYGIGDAAILGEDPVSGAPDGDELSLTVIGDTWALLDNASGSLWISGAEQIVSGLREDAVLQKPSAAASSVYLADPTGLASVNLDGGDTRSLVGDGSAILGIPAAPTPFDGRMHAAWLGGGASGGTLWNSSDGERPLDYAGSDLLLDPLPAFRVNGVRMILNDVQSGWVWTMPDAAIVPSSQDWSLSDEQQQSQNDDVEQASEVIEPKPPVAEPDEFGVRPGRLAPLPVLLNDHDPNEDVLTIVPQTVTGLDPDFGTVTVTDHGGRLAVQVAAGASGTAQFSYAVTDGTRADGLNSEPTTVTLSARGDGENSAPVWCGTAGCLHEWPTPEVAPGGTVTVPVLAGWVDPEGDPIFVQSVENGSGIGSATAMPDGTVVYKHPDAAARESVVVSLAVRVADVHGAVAEKALTVLVTPTPKLSVEPFALTTTVAETLTVDPSAHLRGVTGTYRISSAATQNPADGSGASVNQGGATFEFTAATPGNYLVSFTVTDDAGEVLSFVRVSVLPAETVGISTAPISVFVRPQTDASVDVFTAVSNPGGRVLLLSEALPQPAAGATLDVDVVGQRLLRVRGTSADGQPGELGVVRYTVSDGTGDPAFTAFGEATVYLLPAPVPQAPIAVDDTATVRAGAQIDIPVLANDVGPDGNQLVLDPGSVVQQSRDGLAFASGSVLRYLAPSQAGTYAVRYGIAIAGEPGLTDSATVTIQVMPDGENGDPRPRPLTGRVLSGESVEIRFDGFGVDPDGDSVRLDRVISQPASGTASISATGEAIVYSSVIGFKGAVEFEYRVRDARGGTGTALVRIGVLDQQSDPSPITFTDYVEVQAGASSRVVVEPAANDIDPTGQALRLTEVLPDATAGSAEYDELAAAILERGDTQVIIAAGQAAGTKAFTYTVETATGNIGMGLIVVKVVRESVPDHPIVADTTLSVEDRDSLPAGIDVVTGRTSWASGDISTLKLALWGKSAGFSASGWKISGEVPDQGALLAFTLTGENFLGDTVTTYGFLRIPARAEIVLALNRGDVTQTVDEGAWVTFDIATLVTVPAGETLQVDAGSVRASGQRAQARCTADAGTRVTYAAGTGAPWTDSCTVPVRIAGQDEATALVVPINVVPPEPQPELRAASLTASPAAPAVTYDLAQMTTWQGTTDFSALDYAIEFAGTEFSVTQSGQKLSIQAVDTAAPGRENAVTVRLRSHPEALPAVLSLKVGPAPSELPKGGTVAEECSQAGGSSCVIDVIGAAGESNLYRSTPLVVVSVAVASTCVGVSFAVENTRQVRAAWSAETPGGVCKASFVVRDAQGKLSAAERNGSVTVDLKGYPKAPGSVQQTGYGDGTVTLTVNPGGANVAYPELQGFRVYQAGKEVGTCSAAGQCAPIGSSNGDKRSFEVRAYNAVGESLAAVSAIGWAYAPPRLGEITWEPVYDSRRTTQGQGLIRLTIGQVDDSAVGFTVEGGEPVGGDQLLRLFSVGPQTVQVTPKSRHEQPPVAGAGPQARPISVTVPGGPKLSMSGGFGGTETSIITPTVTVDHNFAEVSAVELRYFLWVSKGWKKESEPRCSANDDGSLRVDGMAGSSQSTFDPVASNRYYSAKACASNGYGVTEIGLGGTRPWAAPAAPTGYSYTVTGSERSYEIQAPASTEVLPEGFVVVFENYDKGSTVWGADPGIKVKYCLEDERAQCGPSSAVTPADGTKAWQVDITGVTFDTCRPGANLGLALLGKGTAAASVAVTSATYGIQDPAHPDKPGKIIWQAPTAGNTPAPADAIVVKDVAWTATFTGSGTTGYASFSGTFADEEACTPSTP